MCTSFISIISNSEVNDVDARYIFDTALKYQYGQDESPIEFKEGNLQRIMVNSIRHTQSNYEYGLKQIHSLKTTEDIYFMYKNNMLQLISDKYPYLSDECERQKHLIEMVKLI